MKRYFLYTNGCYLNKIDTKRIEIFLKENGWLPSRNLHGADIIIFNTCAYSRDKEDGCLSIIKKFQKEKNKKSKLVICGCLPIINKPRLLDNFKGPYFDPHTFYYLGNIMGIEYKVEEIPTAQAILSDKNAFSNNIKKMFCIRVAYGCISRCSFCAVKLVFPKLISKSRTEIVKEFNFGLDNGYRNFALSAEDLSAYGLDIKTNLIELLTDLIEIKGKFNISLYRLNPEGLLRIISDFIRILRSKKIIHLSIPVNSGSDRIITLMNRRYRINIVKNYIKKLKNMFPFLKISLDFMVGFPGEAEKDFRASQEFVLETNPDSIRVYKFTERPGTSAKYLGEEILPVVIDKRSKLLYQCSKFVKQAHK